MSNTTKSLRDEVARAFLPLTRAFGFARIEAHCTDSCETYFGEGLHIRASRDRQYYLDVAGASDPDSWFGVLRVIQVLTGDDLGGGKPLELAKTLSLFVTYLVILREGLGADRLESTKQTLKELRKAAGRRSSP